jgi:4-hydroxybutyryl-CoA dehydratase/vinylacetyl-CoA-Delta-isomerase
MDPTAPVRPAGAQLMTGADYRESLRRHRPTVYVDGRLVESVADEPSLSPGINALSVTYDYAHDAHLAPLMTAVASGSGKLVNRMLHIDESAGDLLNKLEAVRLLCQETGCAQRYLAHDALNAIGQVTARIDDARGGHRAPRPLRGLPAARAGARPVAGHRDDRRQGRPQQAPAPAGQPRHLCAHRRAQRARHRHFGHQGDRHRRALHARVPGHAVPQHGALDADFAVCCAVPVDAPGSPSSPGRPAGPDKVEHGAALFSRRYGQSTGVVIFDRVFVPWERVFLAGEWEHSARSHLPLRHPPPPHLHRRARRLRRPADRRRRADVRGQRLSTDPGERTACANRWSS